MIEETVGLNDLSRATAQPRPWLRGGLMEMAVWWKGLRVPRIWKDERRQYLGP
jgi:hypothetical protein